MLDLILKEVQNVKSDIEEMKDFVVSNKEKLEIHTHDIEVSKVKVAN